LGRYKTVILMFNYRFDVILPHKKFTWTDFGRVYIYTPSPSLRPCRHRVSRDNTQNILGMIVQSNSKPFNVDANRTAHDFI